MPPARQRGCHTSDSHPSLTGDERKEAEKNNEAARLWISGLEAANRKLGLARVIDLSATPFFLRGSRYAEGTLFPWTMSDFSLMDAIECGIVKLPRVPVAENIPGSEMPVFRNLWENIRRDMPMKGRGKAEELDPLALPTRLQTALQALYGHYEKTFRLWEEAGIRVPPCFIVVCNNTSTSKLVYDYLSGFHRQHEDGTSQLENGRLGGAVRCVVSVSMLTEGWDANTVTDVPGVRAFGTQLLCEQVIGRALRRQSYDLNDEGLFTVEYADVLGIPFDFSAKPVVAPPQPPRETITVQAVRPDRDALEIRFPRVEGYRIELPEERLVAEFNADSVLELTPALVGPTVTRNAGILGEGVDLSLEHLADTRHSTLIFHLTQRLLTTKWRDPGEEPKLYLFGQLKRITREWLEGYLVCKGDTYPAQLRYQELADMACERITAGITRAFVGERPVKAVLDP